MVMPCQGQDDCLRDRQGPIRTIVGRLALQLGTLDRAIGEHQGLGDQRRLIVNLSSAVGI